MKLKKLDTDKIEGGTWIDDIPDMGDLRLHVRGIGNAKYRRLQQELIAAVPREKRRKGRLDPIESDRVTATCVLRTILLGWDNLDADDSPGEGHPDRKLVPYSEDLARLYLTDPGYRPFYDAVIYAASIVGEDDAEALKDDAGNSSGTSAGA